MNREDMARHLNQKPLIIQDENLNLLPKKALADGSKLKSLIGSTKRGGAVGKERKALNDITNKSSIRAEVSSKKKNFQKEEFNYAEEGFLHDHTKCIAAQQFMMMPDFLDIVLPGHNEFWNTRHDKSDADTVSSCYYREPVEMPMDEFSEWAKLSSNCESPPSSPLHGDLAPSTLFSWHNEPVEFILKEDSHL